MSAVSDYREPAYRRVSVPTSAHPLVREMFALMHQERMGVVLTAERAGISKDTLKSWRTKHPPTVPLLEACLNALGYKLKIVPEFEDVPPDPSIAPAQWALEGRGRDVAALLLSARNQTLLEGYICDQLDVTPGNLRGIAFRMRKAIEPFGWTIFLAKGRYSLVLKENA